MGERRSGFGRARLSAADAQTIQVSASANSPGALVITGTKVVSATDYRSLTIDLGFITGPGAYPLGVNAGTTPGGIGEVFEQSGTGSGTWTTPLSGAAGTLTVSSMSATRFAGTFQFEAMPQIGSTINSNRVVTGGDFDLALPSSFVAPAANNYGSMVSATVNGATWNGATVVGLGDVSTGALSFGGMTTGVSLNFVTVSAVQAGGTYDQTAVKITETGSGASCCWGGGTGDLSTVTITALGNGRVAGTFVATLLASGGSSSTAPLIVTAGKFDILVNAQ